MSLTKLTAREVGGGSFETSTPCAKTALVGFEPNTRTNVIVVSGFQAMRLGSRAPVQEIICEERVQWS